MCGWLCTTAWQTGISSSAFLAGTIIQGLFVLNLPNYVPHPWHGTLLVIAIASIAICFNTILAKKLPLLEGILVILHLLGVAIVIPLWVLSPIRQGGGALTEYYNGGGWGSVGVASMVGLLPVALSLLGLDCSVHMGKSSCCLLSFSLLTNF